MLRPVPNLELGQKHLVIESSMIADLGTDFAFLSVVTCGVFTIELHPHFGLLFQFCISDEFDSF